MWQVMLGFAAGVYVGTYFDCKPMIIRAKECLKATLPEKKDEKK